ncbi:hypothetical protein GCM10009424_32580 [Sphingomonas ursincola]|uniref:Response regulator transcription factor n=2 Tax=Sphingomonas ursincola TaxID=56361 RepID=A0A7V8U756_9SPHN|nr:response regulator transcription factor [Sphingomonas ursincola]
MNVHYRPALSTAPATGGGSMSPWLLVGSEPTELERLALALARFGIDAQPHFDGPALVRYRPVLCDARCRAVVQSWLDDIPQRSAPLLFVGAGTSGTRARLIEAGADDAISARVGPDELAARMKAAARLNAALQGHIRLANFTFDTGLRQVRWQGETLSLMPREYDLLLALVRHVGEIVSRDDLLHAIWQTPFDPGTNSVEVHICKLRRRLAGMADRVWIETVRHRGYRLVLAAASGG